MARKIKKIRLLSATLLAKKLEKSESDYSEFRFTTKNRDEERRRIFTQLLNYPSYNERALYSSVMREKILAWEEIYFEIGKIFGRSQATDETYGLRKKVEWLWEQEIKRGLKLDEEKRKDEKKD